MKAFGEKYHGGKGKMMKKIIILLVLVFGMCLSSSCSLDLKEDVNSSGDAQEIITGEEKRDQIEGNNTEELSDEEILKMNNHPKVFGDSSETLSFYEQQIDDRKVKVTQIENRSDPYNYAILNFIGCIGEDKNADIIRGLSIYLYNCKKTNEYALKETIELVKEYIDFDVFNTYYKKRFSTYYFTDYQMDPQYYKFSIVYDNINPIGEYPDCLSITIVQDYKGDTSWIQIVPTDAGISEKWDWDYDIKDDVETVPLVDYSEGIEYMQEKNTDEQEDLDDNRTIGENNTDSHTEVESTTSEATMHYIVNKNSKKFHLNGCSSISKIKAKNKMEVDCTRQYLIDSGYSPCSICKP